MTGHYNMYPQDLMCHNIFTSEFSVAATYSALSKLICSCAAPPPYSASPPLSPPVVAHWSCPDPVLAGPVDASSAPVCHMQFLFSLNTAWPIQYTVRPQAKTGSPSSLSCMSLPHPNPFPVPMLYYVVPFIVPWYVLSVDGLRNGMYGLYWWGLGTWIGAGLHGIVCLSGSCTLGHTVSLLVSHSYPIHVPQSLSCVINYHSTFPC
jgi:hypothetical protein